MSENLDQLIHTAAFDARQISLVYAVDQVASLTNYMAGHIWRGAIIDPQRAAMLADEIERIERATLTLKSFLPKPASVLEAA